MPAPSIISLRATPATDRQRVHVRVEVGDIGDPPPYLELHILDPDCDPVAEMQVMGLTEPELDITLHLRPPAPADEERPYTLTGRLFFGREGEEEQTFATAVAPVEFAQPDATLQA